MHSNSYMHAPHLNRYKRKIFGWPHPVQSPLFPSMKVSLTICLTLILIAPADSEKIPYIIPYNYYDLWMVVAQNSSGRLFFDTTPNARRVFIWKLYNASDYLKLFFEKSPFPKKVSTEHHTGVASADIPCRIKKPSSR